MKAHALLSSHEEEKQSCSIIFSAIDRFDLPSQHAKVSLRSSCSQSGCMFSQLRHSTKPIRNSTEQCKDNNLLSH
jgi:hypothetical protein